MDIIVSCREKREISLATIYYNIMYIERLFQAVLLRADFVSRRCIMFIWIFTRYYFDIYVSYIFFTGPHQAGWSAPFLLYLTTNLLVFTPGSKRESEDTHMAVCMFPEFQGEKREIEMWFDDSAWKICVYCRTQRYNQCYLGSMWWERGRENKTTIKRVMAQNKRRKETNILLFWDTPFYRDSKQSNRVHPLFSCSFFAPLKISIVKCREGI